MSNDNKKEQDVPVLDHEYDGIQELDNNLPSWWLATFYITILFAAGYVFHYHLQEGPSTDDELHAELTAIEARQLSSQPAGGEALSADKLNAFFKDGGKITAGKAVFAGKCASCHGDKGQGMIGPNLTDKHWLNGDGTLPAIAKVIKEGVGAKGMPPWGPLLSDEELYSVTAYVKSIKGTNPPGAKAPQGNAYEN